MRGRTLGRTPSHRKAMFRNMACSLIRSVRVDEEDEQKPKVAGRIVTTVAKAKSLRPFVEKLITMARKAAEHEANASRFATSADRNSSEWKSWRESDEWRQWSQAVAPAVDLRRRAFARLRDKEAVDILFDELAERFQDRPGGYTRVVRLPSVRLGDAGQQAIVEFVGDRDRIRRKRKAPVVATDEEAPVAAGSEEATGKIAAEAEGPAAEEQAEAEETAEQPAESSSAAETDEEELEKADEPKDE